MRPLLVGEDNPHSADPRHALYPYPEHCAGGRLCVRVMGLTPREYLCSGAWKMAEARLAARSLFGRERVYVLLGAKVASAFGLAFHAPFTRMRWSNPLWRMTCTVVQLPHPSGRARAWNEPGAFERARAVLREAGALPPLPSEPPTQENRP